MIDVSGCSAAWPFFTHVHRISATVSAKKAVRMTGIHYVLCVAEVKGASHFHNGKWTEIPSSFVAEIVKTPVV